MLPLEQLVSFLDSKKQIFIEFEHRLEPWEINDLRNTSETDNHEKDVAEDEEKELKSENKEKPEEKKSSASLEKNKRIKVEENNRKDEENDEQKDEEKEQPKEQEDNQNESQKEEQKDDQEEQNGENSRDSSLNEKTATTRIKCQLLGIDEHMNLVVSHNGRKKLIKGECICSVMSCE